jgi:pyruvate kinase
LAVSRKLSLVWGVHSVHINDPDDASKLATMAAEVALSEGFAKKGKPIVIIAGLPFGESGSTNLMRITIV